MIFRISLSDQAFQSNRVLNCLFNIPKRYVPKPLVPYFITIRSIKSGPVHFFGLQIERIISIPLFSRRCDSFLTAFQIVPFHSSDPTFSFRSDLRYVPTLRTSLLYTYIFILRLFIILLTRIRYKHKIIFNILRLKNRLVLQIRFILRII